jgi:ATP-dependent protease ClpP protease subunit
MFFDEVSKESADMFIKAMHLLDNDSQKTITVLITTDGGDVDHGLRMLDAVRLLKSPSRAICYGGVESMGTVILQAFLERCMAPNSFLMIHEGEAGVSGRGKDRKEWNRLLEFQENVCISEYLEKINHRQREKKKRMYKKDELISILENDKILLPNEAVAMGLADRVIKEAY